MRCEVQEKRFGDAVILRNVALDIVPREFVALTGPSGSGKTTLMRIIAGLDADFSGQVEGAERIGVVFQEPRLLPWRNVIENLKLVAPAAPEADLKSLLDHVGLGGTAAMYPGQLSTGMARRAAIARALAVKPELLLLDEPFVSLDEDTANSLRALIMGLWKEQGFRVLMITHDPAEAREMAGRILALSGRPAGLS